MINWNLLFIFLGLASRAILTNGEMVIEEHVDLGVRFEKYEINIKIQEMDLDWTRLI